MSATMDPMDIAAFSPESAADWTALSVLIETTAPTIEAKATEYLNALGALRGLTLQRVDFGDRRDGALGVPHAKREMVHTPGVAIRDSAFEWQAGIELVPCFVAIADDRDRDDYHLNVPMSVLWDLDLTVANAKVAKATYEAAREARLAADRLASAERQRAAELETLRYLTGKYPDEVPS